MTRGVERGGEQNMGEKRAPTYDELKQRISIEPQLFVITKSLAHI
jgi:hypothetical protein